jgi:hypothetical protein
MLPPENPPPCGGGPLFVPMIIANGQPFGAQDKLLPVFDSFPAAARAWAINSEAIGQG